MFHCITSRVRSPLPNEEQTTLPLPPAPAARCKCSGDRWQPAAALPAPERQHSLTKTQGNRQFCSTLWRREASGDLHQQGLPRNGAPEPRMCAGLRRGLPAGGGGSPAGAEPGGAGAAALPERGEDRPGRAAGAALLPLPGAGSPSARR